MKPGKLNDKLLYQRLKDKDKEAFVKTYDLYFDHIYRFIFFKVSSKEEAEDLTSAVFLKTWGYVQDKSVKDYQNLKALLYKVARNLVIDHYRKKSNQVEHLSLDDRDTSPEIHDAIQDPHKDLEMKESYAELSAKLFELKDEYRELIVMRYVNEMSIGEIASALDKSSGSIRVSLYRALKALRALAGNNNS